MMILWQQLQKLGCWTWGHRPAGGHMPTPHPASVTHHCIKIDNFCIVPFSGEHKVTALYSTDLHQFVSYARLTLFLSEVRGKQNKSSKKQTFSDPPQKKLNKIIVLLSIQSVKLSWTQEKATWQNDQMDVENISSCRFLPRFSFQSAMCNFKLPEATPVINPYAKLQTNKITQYTEYSILYTQQRGERKKKKEKSQVQDTKLK